MHDLTKFEKPNHRFGLSLITKGGKELWLTYQKRFLMKRKI